MTFTRRLVENFGQRTNTGENRARADNQVINQIIVHHTGGWPHNTANDLAPSYHFLVETGLDQHATRIIGGGRVALMSNVNTIAPHAGAWNANSIGISVAGNHDNAPDAVPPTNMDRIPGARAQVERHLTQIIADCLISFPTISRINRTTSVPVRDVPQSASGILWHHNVSNQPCPGHYLRRPSIVDRAINMANTFDAAERLRALPQIAGTTQSINFARNANELTSGLESLGTFIVRLDANRNSISRTPQSSPAGVNGAIQNLFNLRIIATDAARIAMQNGHARIPGLGAFLLNVAEHLPAR